MSARVRVFVVAGAIAVVIAVALFAGLVLLDRSPSDSTDNRSPTPTATNPRAEVEIAYLAFWDTFARALLELEPNLLDEVATGEALTVLKEQAQEQKDQNQPVQVRVEHNYTIQIIDDSTASVEDRYVSHNVRLDPETKEPIESDPNEQLHYSYTLRKVDGRWKVAEVIEVR